MQLHLEWPRPPPAPLIQARWHCSTTTPGNLFGGGAADNYASSSPSPSLLRPRLPHPLRAPRIAPAEVSLLGGQGMGKTAGGVLTRQTCIRDGSAAAASAAALAESALEFERERGQHTAARRGRGGSILRSTSTTSKTKLRLGWLVLRAPGDDHDSS
jgi:hypothetical protein